MVKLGFMILAAPLPPYSIILWKKNIIYSFCNFRPKEVGKRYTCKNIKFAENLHFWRSSKIGLGYINELRIIVGHLNVENRRLYHNSIRVWVRGETRFDLWVIAFVGPCGNLSCHIWARFWNSISWRSRFLTSWT